MKINLLVDARNHADSWNLGSITDFLTQVLLKTNPARHRRANETLPCPYNAVVVSIWKNKSGSFLFVMSLWLLVAAKNRADSWDPSLIF